MQDSRFGLISIVMAAYNAERTIKYAVQLTTLHRI